jgi:hypothetical protein
MQKDMDEMKSKTDEMQKSVKKTEKQGEDMKDTLPIGAGLDAMRTAFKIIIDENSGDTTKLAEAAAYFQAMPYEFWAGHGNNLKELSKRDDYIYNDIRYTLYNIDQYINHDFKLPGMVDMNNNSYRILSALSAAMSEVHPYQTRKAAENNFQVRSVYDVVTDALIQKDFYRKSKSMPRSVDIVLQYENECKYLLEIRYNHLLLIATSFLTYIGDKNLLEKMWEIMSSSNFSKDVKLVQFSDERLNWVNTVLKGAKDTKDVLVQLKEPVQLSDAVKKLFKAMKPVKSNAKDISPERAKIEAELIANMNSLP